jgi:hypothetical protein
MNKVYGFEVSFVRCCVYKGGLWSEGGSGLADSFPVGGLVGRVQGQAWGVDLQAVRRRVYRT